MAPVFVATLMVSGSLLLALGLLLVCGLAIEDVPASAACASSSRRSSRRNSWTAWSWRPGACGRAIRCWRRSA